MKTLNILYEGESNENLNVLYEGESNENLKYFYTRANQMKTLNIFIRGWVKWKP
jgi:hypothetical protein